MRVKTWVSYVSLMTYGGLFKNVRVIKHNPIMATTLIECKKFKWPLRYAFGRRYKGVTT